MRVLNSANSRVCRAIAEAHSLYELLPIRDRAAHIAAAAKIAKNIEAEQKCREIRVRAERKAGQLTAEMPTSSGNQLCSVARWDKAKGACGDRPFIHLQTCARQQFAGSAVPEVQRSREVAARAPARRLGQLEAPKSRTLPNRRRALLRSFRSGGARLPCRQSFPARILS